MTDLTAQILHFNPSLSEAILAFIENDEVNHPDAMMDFDCDIQEFDRCVVGEIHGFDNTFASDTVEQDELEPNEKYCGVCVHYGNELSARYSDTDRSMFAELLVQLYNHVRENHND